MAVSSGQPAPIPVGEPRTVTILGSTGSVGCQTIDLIERHNGRYTVEALTANSNIELLAAQARSLRPRFVALAEESGYPALKQALSGLDIEIGVGPEAVVAAAERPAEWIMAAIVGSAGLQATLAAVRRGAIVAFANKECLVCAGELMMREIDQRGATLLPVDSEHNAIFQVFEFDRRSAVEKLVLTASGGPFRDWDLARMGQASPSEAVAHPNWDMGAKISVDSATMMNKGLEVIEAHHLFSMPEERIEVVVHPQSVIHSMVTYVDGSVLAQLGTPDMRTPIAYTLAWPERMATPAERLDWASLSTLTFEQPDSERFPALRLAREVLKIGGRAPTILNAANEVAVASFLEGRIGFLDIAGIVEETLTSLPNGALSSIADVHQTDDEARRLAQEIVQAKS
ncbi:MAG: 1-deoxy-D-xylulose-5-phosphate reductoisomerase [Alphaproteobacteria bacterium]|nr:1-deoxy-D-xylulose-5-phosphate reductoisomerase [Alphaproteobacteria bacterium]